jgi:hypothetical protein
MIDCGVSFNFFAIEFGYLFCDSTSLFDCDY